MIDRIIAVQSPQQSGIQHDRHEDILALILDRIPSYVLCSNSLKTASVSSARREKKVALTKQWVSFNSRDFINAMVFDCDHDNWPHFLNRLREQGIPDPTLIVRSALTGTAHITWWWKKGKRKACRKLMRIYEGIHERLRAELCADSQFKQYLCKNPLHDAYEVVLFNGQEYEFSDFLQPLIEFAGPDDYILSPRWEAQFEGDAPMFNGIKLSPTHIYGEKGSKVWETGRQRVYRYRSADYAIILRIYTEVAAELGSPIKPRALQGMARRTAAWMKAHPNMLGTPASDLRNIDHRLMTKEAEQRHELAAWHALDVTSKRMLAAERTNAIRQASTEQRITHAVKSLLDRNLPITQTTLQQESSVSIPTIKRLWNKNIGSDLKGIIRSNPFSPPLKPASLACLGGENLTLKQLSLLSKERASRFKQEQESISEYNAQAQRMKKRGATVEVVKPRDIGASEDLKTAHAAALDARKDCIRRADARMARKEQKSQAQQRKQRFHEWAAAGDTASYRAFLSKAGEHWNAILEQLAGDKQSRERVHLYRATAFKRYQTEWQSVLMDVATDDCRKTTYRMQKDRLDLMADRIPLSPEQLTVQRITAHMRARQEIRCGLS